MLKQTSTTSILLIIAALLSGIAALSLPGCEPGENPGLSNKLNRLVQAYRQGEVEEFTRQRGTETIDGSVRVIIECVPGQVEAAAEAATDAGAQQVRSRDNLVKALVPIANLTALDEVESIHLIRLPWEPSEE